MKIKNNGMFLAFLSYSLATSLASCAVEARLMEHVEPAGENEIKTDTRQHEQQEEEARKEAAEALRLRTLTANHSDPLALPDAPHTLTTELPPDNTTTSAPITTVAGEEASSLIGITAEGAEAVERIGRGEHDFKRPFPIENESPEQITIRESMEKKLAFMRLFQEELTLREMTTPENQKLKPNEIVELKNELRRTIQENPTNFNAIKDKISELLQKVPSPKNIPQEQHAPTQKKEPAKKAETVKTKSTLTPEQQKIIADAIARGKAHPEFKIFIKFRTKLMNEKHLELIEAIDLANELKDIVTRDPNDSAAIEQKEAELLKKADRLNNAKEVAKKTTLEEKAAQKRAIQEKTAHEASEMARIKDLKKMLMNRFENELITRTYLSEKETTLLDEEFETLVSKNPDATDAISKKSTEFLKLADLLNEQGRLAAKKAVDETVEKDRQETARQNEKPLDTAIEKIKAIDPQTALALRTLKATIEAKGLDATADQILVLQNVIRTVTDGLPKDTPNGKTVFGRKTNKWSSAQKKQAQKALDTANRLLADTFPERPTPPASVTEIDRAQKKQAKAPEQPTTTEKTSPSGKKPWRQRLLEALKKTFKSPRKTN